MKPEYKKECCRIKKIDNKMKRSNESIKFLKKISQNIIRNIDKKEYNTVFNSLNANIISKNIDFNLNERWICLLNEDNFKKLDIKNNEEKKTILNYFSMDNTYSLIAFILKDHFELKNKFALLLLFLAIIIMADFTSIGIMKTISPDFNTNNINISLKNINSFIYNFGLIHSLSYDIINTLFKQYIDFNLHNNNSNNLYFINTSISLVCIVIFLFPIFFELVKKGRIKKIYIILFFMIFLGSCFYLPAIYFYISTIVIMLTIIILFLFIREIIILLSLSLLYTIFNDLFLLNEPEILINQKINGFSLIFLFLFLSYSSISIVRFFYIRFKNKYSSIDLYKFIYYIAIILFLFGVFSFIDNLYIKIVSLIIVLYHLAMNIKYNKFIFSINEVRQIFRFFIASIIASYTAYIFIGDKGLYFLKILAENFNF